MTTFTTPRAAPIARSRVTAEGDTAAIMAVVNSADGSISGTINIVDSIIETPDGGRICDVRFDDTGIDDAPSSVARRSAPPMMSSRI